MKLTTSLENFLREMRSPGVMEGFYKPDNYYVKRGISHAERYAREQCRKGNSADLEMMVNLAPTKYVSLKEDIQKNKEEYLRNPESEEELDEAIRSEDWGMIEHGIHRIETNPVKYDNQELLDAALKGATSAMYFDGSVYIAGKGVFMRLDEDGTFHDLYNGARLEQNGDRALCDYFNGGDIAMKLSDNGQSIDLYQKDKDPFFEKMEVSYNPAKQTYRLKAENDFWLNHNVYGA